MLTVYYMPRTRAQRVLWLLEEMDLPYESVLVRLEDRRSPEHLERHPLGRVPAVRLEDGTYMFESAAICLHLAAEHPEAGLMPDGTAGRALATQWTVFAMTELEAPFARWNAALRNGTEDETARERFAAAAETVSRVVGRREWLLGERFSVADVVSVGVLGMAHSRGMLDPWPPLGRYVERGERRPAYQRVLAHMRDVEAASASIRTADVR